MPSGPGSPLRRSWRWWTIGVLVVLVGLAVAFGPRLEPEGTATADGGPTTASPTTGAPTTVPNGTDSTGEPAELYPCAPASPQELAAIEATLYGGATFESAAAYRAGAFSWVVGNLRSPSGGPIAGDLAWIVVDGRVGTLSPDAASFSEAPAAIDVFLDLPPDAQEVAHALYDCLR